MKRCKRILAATDVNYKIICAGSDFDIGQGQEVTVCFAGKEYQAKTHSKTKGRIDGLSKLFKDFDFAVGDTLELTYYEEAKAIFIIKNKNTNAENQLDKMISSNSMQHKWGENGTQEAASRVEENALVSRERIRDIFSGMDLVAKHWEYYLEKEANISFVPTDEFDRKTSAASNNEWVTYKFNRRSTTCYLRNENTNEVFTFKLDEKLQQAIIIGLNPAGIWLMDYGKDNESFGYIYCYCPYTGQTRKISFNGKRSKHISSLCIHDKDIYYISQISETKMKLFHIDEIGNEMELFTDIPGKKEKISNLAVAGDYLTVHITGEHKEENKWIIYHLMNGNRLSIPETMVSIKMMDLSKGIMWTSITHGEASMMGVQDAEQIRAMWIARKIRPVKEGDYLHYKNSAPALWNTYNHSIGYFDGTVMYSIQNYWEMHRIEANGKTVKLSGLDKHGQCNKMMVSKKHLYVSFDARIPVQLPKKFSGFEGIAEDNPEAVLLGELWNTF